MADLVQIAFDAYTPAAGECPHEGGMEAAVSAVQAALRAQPAGVKVLPPTGAYIDRMIRIFRDHPTDDTSALVLQDYARAALEPADRASQPIPANDEMIEAGFRAFSERIFMREEDRSLVRSVIEAALAARQCMADEADDFYCPKCGGGPDSCRATGCSGADPAALSKQEVVAYRVHDFHVARSPVKAKGKFPEPTEYLYLVSRERDAKDTARIMGGTCTPLYASPVPAEPSAEGWRPIETAPKDGSEVIGICADAQSPVPSNTWWDERRGRWLTFSKPEQFLISNPHVWFPTHWLPLPPAPHGEGA